MPKPNRTLLTLRSIAFAQQRARCWYCHVRMWNRSTSELPGLPAHCYRQLKATAEHLIARSEGGPDSRENIVAACAKCNHTRHRRKEPPSPLAYKNDVEKRIRSGRWHARDIFVRGLLPPIRPHL
jgi:5-methylcytosine-specific restriction endonuclease McrA